MISVVLHHFPWNENQQATLLASLPLLFLKGKLFSPDSELLRHISAPAFFPPALGVSSFSKSCQFSLLSIHCRFIPVSWTCKIDQCSRPGWRNGLYIQLPSKKWQNRTQESSLILHPLTLPSDHWNREIIHWKTSRLGEPLVQNSRAMADVS